jgi:hypothetical protein
MSVKKCVLPNYVDKKLQVCKMSKLHIFVITNICNQIFVTFGRIGARLHIPTVMIWHFLCTTSPNTCWTGTGQFC